MIIHPLFEQEKNVHVPDMYVSDLKGWYLCTFPSYSLDQRFFLLQELDTMV